ncbi:hypothetical protein F5887DRAFT_995039, partial [Amanita rubescens]
MQSHNVHSYDEFLLSDDQVPTPGDSSSAHSSTLLEFHQPAVVRSDDDDHDAYRSPPFIQAPLPDDDYPRQAATTSFSASHFPVRPRIAMSSNPDSAALALSGHTRSPILAREQSTLQSFSHTLRTYVPSAIHIPVPSPLPFPPSSLNQARTRPDPNIVPIVQFPPRRGDHDHPPSPRSHGRTLSQPAGLAQALQYREDHHNSRSPRGLSYPGSEATHAEPIQWAKWDRINDKRFLILAYPSGFQLWDCTSLSSVTEVLNLNTTSDEWHGGGEIVHAALLPSPSSQAVRHFGDPYAQDRPLLGIIINLDNDKDSSTLFIYSLSRQGLIHQVELNGQAVSFEANAHFIVISLTNPATLQIYSPTTFKPIYTISSSSLIPFAHSRGIYSSLASKLFTTGGNNKNYEQSVFLGQGQPEEQQSHPAPRPVFALSHRLLAYASPPSLSSISGTQARPHRSPSCGSGADLGNAAIKVGGSLLSGMKTLGGMALTAAKNHMMASSSPSSVNYYYDSPANTAATTTATTLEYARRQPSYAHQQQQGGGHRKYVSISDSRSRGRRYSVTSMTSQDSTGRSYSGSEQAHQTSASPVVPNVAIAEQQRQGSYCDDFGLDAPPYGRTQHRAAGGGGGSPVVVAEWLTSRSQPVAGLKFSPDGCSLIVVPMNGQVSHVWQIRPSPGVLRISQIGVVGTGSGDGDLHSKSGRENSGSGGVGSGGGPDVMVRMYHLHRGRSPAVIDDVAWAQDGRWVAIGSQRPTVHVFPVNPYGGKPDLRSHTKGKVINVNELQPSSVEVSPLVRLRASKPGLSDPRARRASLAFAFVDSPEACLPSSGELLSTSPHHRSRPTNYQDLLVFDPADGMLSLQRITTDVKAKDQSLSVAASVSMSALGATATSVSLPGLGGAGKLSSSPASSIAYSISAASNASSRNTNPDLGKESVVATWNLQRRRDWEEIRQPIVLGTRKMKNKSNYLAYAELSTFSRSPRVLHRSVYLSHQFSFYTLGEDYHALLRRSQLDISGQKLEVRKNVEISPFPSSSGTHDAGGFAHHRHHHHHTRRISGSFDEPLASALAGGLEYSSIAPPVLPMYPNGAPSSRPRTLRNSIPIRTIGDGMSEGLSLLRREINKVRSPHLLPRTEHGPPSTTSPGLVPLEFDEEDEDFLGRDTLDALDSGPSERERGDVVPVPDVSSSPIDHALIDDVDDVSGGGGWDSQDRQAVEDEERFHDLLIAPGTFGEETVVLPKQEEKERVGSSSSGGKKKKGKSKKLR